MDGGCEVVVVVVVVLVTESVGGGVCVAVFTLFVFFWDEHEMSECLHEIPIHVLQLNFVLCFWRLFGLVHSTWLMIVHK